MKPRSALLRASLGASLVALLSAAMALTLLPDLRWRGVVVVKKATGELSDITWSRLISMLRPGSGFWLQPVAEGGSLYAAIANPYNRPEDVTRGEELFRSQCSACHGEHASEMGAPDLRSANFAKGDSDWAIFRVITEGVPQSAMVGSSLQDIEVWQVIAYVRSLRASRNLKSNPPANVSISDVTYDRLVNAGDEPENWLTYSGAYNGQRYSRLDEIDRTNVRNLAVRWVYQLPTEEPHSETTPLVVDDVMYLTVSPNLDLAVNAGTGEVLWQNRRSLPQELANCCGPHNRGVAILGRRIYRGTLDGHLIARDALTGRLLWDVEVGAASEGFSITAAPLAVDGKVITGVAGAEYGIRGYLDAYDAVTGQRLWRFYTIPGEGEPGNETWSGDSWMRGGGATWMTGSFDPELRLLYWGVANPAPDFNGDGRQGDNLYTNSVIAVDVDSGSLRWHFQFTPHDLHDWDANQVPMLIDAIVGGDRRQLLVTANKNGFAYVLDRRSGEFLLAHEVTDQTWADAIDEDGRPIPAAGTEPSPEGTYVRPGAGGGANWWPPSYNPLTGLVHYSVADTGAIFFKSDVEFEEGVQYLGSGGLRAQGEATVVAVRAFRAGTSELAWEYTAGPRYEWPRIAGSLTTAGMLVFLGDNQYFIALDAETGEVLWRMNLGGSIHAAPITYRSNGRQHVAIAAGRSLYSFTLPD